MDDRAVAKEIVKVAKLVAGAASVKESNLRKSCQGKLKVSWNALHMAMINLQLAMREGTAKDKDVEIVRKLDNMKYALGEMIRDVVA